MNLRNRLDRAGELLVDGFQFAGLFVLGATIVWAAGFEYVRMMGEGRVRLEYTVNADGSVGVVVEAFPVEVFTRTARRAVASWRFVPTGASERRTVQFDFRAQ